MLSQRENNMVVEALQNCTYTINANGQFVMPGGYSIHVAAIDKQLIWNDPDRCYHSIQFQELPMWAEHKIRTLLA